MLCFSISAPDIEHVQFQTQGEEDPSVERTFVRAVELGPICSEKWKV
jgi:hypothetical protein